MVRPPMSHRANVSLPQPSLPGGLLRASHGPGPVGRAMVRVILLLRIRSQWVPPRSFALHGEAVSICQATQRVNCPHGRVTSQTFPARIGCAIRTASVPAVACRGGHLPSATSGSLPSTHVEIAPRQRRSAASIRAAGRTCPAHMQPLSASSALRAVIALPNGPTPFLCIRAL